MPELGINLISQSKISSNYYTIFTKNNIYIKNYQGITITKGNKINSLYYLDIIPNIKEKILTIIDNIKNTLENKENSLNKSLE